MTETSALDSVIAYQNAWTTGDFETARRYLADDFVLHGLQQHLTSAEAAISMLTTFVQRIAPRWEQIAANSEGGTVLILYKLFMLDGTPATCADYFAVMDGQIQSEILVFDPKPFMAAQAQQ